LVSRESSDSKDGFLTYETARRLAQQIGIDTPEQLESLISDLGIGEKDVFINVAGGLRSQDPGLDLAVVAAVVSSCVGKNRSDIVLSRVASRAISLSDRPIRMPTRSSSLGATGDQFPRKKISSLFNRSSHSSHFNHLSSRPIFCGEVGLLGEIRMVQGWERREKEIKRLGLGKLVGKSDIGSILELREFL